MKYYIIAGERSGDLHAGALIRHIKELDPDAELRGWGGEQMETQGVTLVRHYRDMAFMGFLEVLKNLGTIKKLMKQCKADILYYQPDQVILIDYPGFNLRMAAFAKKNGLTVNYYISPKVWAWNQKRAYKIKANVDRLFSILPFEVAFYERFGLKAQYVGNPLVSKIAQYEYDQDFISKHKGSQPIAVLPGSRKQEVLNALDIIQAVIERFPNEVFLIAGVDNLPVDLYAKVSSLKNAQLVFDKTYEIAKAAKLAIVTSGTATLETAIIGTPQVVIYKTSVVSYAIARRLIRVPYISLVNLIADREVVPELIQHDFNVDKVYDWLKRLSKGDDLKKQLEGYQKVCEALGNLDSPRLVAETICGIENEKGR